MKSYALALCAFLLIEEEIEEVHYKEIQQLFVEVYKDRVTFTENLLECFEKTDALLDNHIRRRVTLREHDEIDVDNHHDPEETLTLLLDNFENKSIVEITNIFKGFTKKNGKQIIDVAHTKLKKVEPILAKAIKELKDSDSNINQAITSGINTFTKPKAGLLILNLKLVLKFPFTSYPVDLSKEFVRCLTCLKLMMLIPLMMLIRLLNLKTILDCTSRKAEIP